MLKNIRNKKAQNTAEYAILIALVIGGVVAMQTYAQRALQARVRDTSRFMADRTGNGTIGQDAEGGLGAEYNTLQYEPYYSNSTEETAKTSTDIKSKTDQTVTAKASVLTNKTKSQDTTIYNGVYQ